jgi:RHS repeat-associated protein
MGLFPRLWELTLNGVTTKYLVDTNNLTGYAQVVEELQNNQVVKQYTYGLDLISQRQSSGVSFYNYDGHGSVRGLSNVSGNVTDTYAYDAFGTIIERTGTTDNNYLYAGEQFDSDLGFYYNRARYLNVETGRFISFDTYEGNNQDPISLHKYLYANADGVNKIDPSGNSGFDLTSLTGAGLINNILATMSVVRNVITVYARANLTVEKLKILGALFAIIVGVATASNNNDGFTADFPFKSSTADSYPDVKFGLERRVSANGNINWIIRWQVDGKRVRISLGDDPAAISGGINYTIWEKKTAFGEFGIDIAFRAGTEFNPQGRQSVGVAFEFKYKFLKYFSNTARIRFLSVALQGGRSSDNFVLGTDGQILE